MDTTVFRIVALKIDRCIEINQKYCGIFGMLSSLIRKCAIAFQIVCESGLRLI